MLLIDCPSGLAHVLSESGNPTNKHQRARPFGHFGNYIKISRLDGQTHLANCHSLKSSRMCLTFVGPPNVIE
jgi:hypothetical protein